MIAERISGWNVLRTRSKHEGVVEKRLFQKQILSYVPRFPITRRSPSSKNTSMGVPIFPGYIFVKPNIDQIQLLNYIPGTCGLLLIQMKPGIVPESEINAIHTLLKTGTTPNLHCNLIPGDRVKVLRGQLAGLEGELVRFNNEKRLVLNVKVFGQALSININSMDVVRIGGVRNPV